MSMEPFEVVILSCIILSAMGFLGCLFVELGVCRKLGSLGLSLGSKPYPDGVEGSSATRTLNGDIEIGSGSDLSVNSISVYSIIDKDSIYSQVPILVRPLGPRRPVERVGGRVSESESLAKSEDEREEEGFINRVREVQESLKMSSVLGYIKANLIIGVETNPKGVYGYCVNLLEKTVKLYTYHHICLPWTIKDRDDPDEISLLNLKFALLLWEREIMSSKTVRLYTGSQPDGWPTTSPSQSQIRSRSQSFSSQTTQNSQSSNNSDNSSSNTLNNPDDDNGHLKTKVANLMGHFERCHKVTWLTGNTTTTSATTCRGNNGSSCSFIGKNKDSSRDPMFLDGRDLHEREDFEGFKRFVMFCQPVLDLAQWKIKNCERFLGNFYGIGGHGFAKTHAQLKWNKVKCRPWYETTPYYYQFLEQVEAADLKWKGKPCIKCGLHFNNRNGEESRKSIGAI